MAFVRSFRTWVVIACMAAISAGAMFFQISIINTRAQPHVVILSSASQTSSNDDSINSPSKSNGKASLLEQLYSNVHSTTNPGSEEAICIPDKWLDISNVSSPLQVSKNLGGALDAIEDSLNVPVVKFSSCRTWTLHPTRLHSCQSLFSALASYPQGFFTDGHPRADLRPWMVRCILHPDSDQRLKGSSANGDIEDLAKGEGVTINDSESHSVFEARQMDKHQQSCESLPDFFLILASKDQEDSGLPGNVFRTHSVFMLMSSSDQLEVPTPSKSHAGALMHALRAYAEHPHHGLLEAFAPYMVGKADAERLIGQLKSSGEEDKVDWHCFLAIRRTAIFAVTPPCKPASWKVHLDTQPEFSEISNKENQEVCSKEPQARKLPKFEPQPSLPFPLTVTQGIPNSKLIQGNPTISRAWAMQTMSNLIMKLPAGQIKTDGNGAMPVLCTGIGGCVCSGGLRLVGKQCVNPSPVADDKTLLSTIASVLNADKSGTGEGKFTLASTLGSIWSNHSVLDITSGKSAWVRHMHQAGDCNLTIVCYEGEECPADEWSSGTDSDRLHIITVLQENSMEEALSNAMPWTGWEVVIGLNGLFSALPLGAQATTATILSSVISVHAFLLTLTRAFGENTYLDSPWAEPWSIQRDLSVLSPVSIWAMRGEQLYNEFGCKDCVLSYSTVSGIHTSLGKSENGNVVGDVYWTVVDYINGVHPCKTEALFTHGNAVEQAQYFRSWNRNELPVDRRIFVATEQEFWERPLLTVDQMIQVEDGGQSNQRLHGGGSCFNQQYEWVVWQDFQVPKEKPDTSTEEIRKVTLATHIDINRINMLQRICQHWQSYMSVAIMVTSSTDRQVLQEGVSDACLQQHAFIHLIRSAADVQLYAVNVVRNTAMWGARTKEVIQMDADFVPMDGTADRLNAAISTAYSPDGKRSKKLFVSLAGYSDFEYDGPITVEDFNDNIEYQSKAKYNVYPLYDSPYGPENRDYQGHGSTDYISWRFGEGLYPIAFVRGYEPYFVTPIGMEDTPHYDERFKRWGADKQVMVLELASRGYEFLGVPGAGFVHFPHARTGKRGQQWETDKVIVNKPYNVMIDMLAKESVELPPQWFPAQMFVDSRSGKLCSHMDFLFTSIDAVRVELHETHIEDPVNLEANKFPHDLAVYVHHAQRSRDNQNQATFLANIHKENIQSVKRACGPWHPQLQVEESDGAFSEVPEKMVHPLTPNWCVMCNEEEEARQIDPRCLRK